MEYIIEYESGISNIRRELRYAQRNLYCRVFILYANSEDAEIIFTEIIQQEMDQTDYVWIVSEQVSLRYLFLRVTQTPALPFNRH